MSLLISFHSTKHLIHDFNTVNDGKELKMKGDHATMPHRKQYPAKYFLFTNQNEFLIIACSTLCLETLHLRQKSY